MLDHEFRENVIAALSRLETLAIQQKEALVIARTEHTDLEDQVSALSKRMDWFSGVGSTLFVIYSSLLAWLGMMHRAK